MFTWLRKEKREKKKKERKKRKTKGKPKRKRKGKERKERGSGRQPRERRERDHGSKEKEEKVTASNPVSRQNPFCAVLNQDLKNVFVNDFKCFYGFYFEVQNEGLMG